MSSRPQILLVDDEPGLLRCFSRFLGEEFEVHTAEDAETAAVWLDGGGTPAVVVADFGLPGANGLEFLERCVRTHGAASRVLLTGTPEVDMAREAIERTGLHRFLCKPCDAEELRETVRSGAEAHLRSQAEELAAAELAFERETLRLMNNGLEERIAGRDATIQHLRRLGVEMGSAKGMADIARAAARSCHAALGRRGVCVQIIGPEGGTTECSMGPEMSERLVSEALVTRDGPIGEITVDVIDAEGRPLDSCDQNTLGSIASTVAVAAQNEFRRTERDDAQYATVVALARLSERRDEETGQHLERVSEYCRLAAEGLVRRGRHTNTIDEAWIRDLVCSAPLHDIGKVGIPDSILLKRGKLSEGEWEIMKTHAEIGAETLRSVIRAQKAPSYLEMGLDITLCHHEKWDGSGYPAGLSGPAIPLAARILALADVYDALTTVRPYKAAWTHEEALAQIEASRGGHFDPEVVDAFIDRAEEVDQVRRRMADDEPVDRSA